MPYAQIEDGIRLYNELTGPGDAPVILQFGGGLGHADLVEPQEAVRIVTEFVEQALVEA
jgi:hypothetical protein